MCCLNTWILLLQVALDTKSSRNSFRKIRPKELPKKLPEKTKHVFLAPFLQPGREQLFGHTVTDKISDNFLGRSG